MSDDTLAARIDTLNDDCEKLRMKVMNDEVEADKKESPKKRTKESTSKKSRETLQKETKESAPKKVQHPKPTQRQNLTKFGDGEVVGNVKIQPSHEVAQPMIGNVKTKYEVSKAGNVKETVLEYEVNQSKAGNNSKQDKFLKLGSKMIQPTHEVAQPKIGNVKTKNEVVPVLEYKVNQSKAGNNSKKDKVSKVGSKMTQPITEYEVTQPYHEYEDYSKLGKGVTQVNMTHQLKDDEAQPVQGNVKTKYEVHKVGNVKMPTHEYEVNPSKVGNNSKQEVKKVGNMMTQPRIVYEVTQPKSRINETQLNHDYVDQSKTGKGVTQAGMKPQLKDVEAQPIQVNFSTATAVSGCFEIPLHDLESEDADKESVVFQKVKDQYANIQILAQNKIPPFLSNPPAPPLSQASRLPPFPSPIGAPLTSAQEAAAPVRIGTAVDDDLLTSVSGPVGIPLLRVKFEGISQENRQFAEALVGYDACRGDLYYEDYRNGIAMGKVFYDLDHFDTTAAVYSMKKAIDAINGPWMGSIISTEIR